MRGCGHRLPDKEYRLANETSVVATSKAGLLDGTIANSIAMGPDGGGLGFLTHEVWTGTTADGTKQTNTCADWTIGTNASSGAVGDRTTTNSTWTAQSTGNTCNNTRKLFCFETARNQRNRNRGQSP